MAAYPPVSFGWLAYVALAPYLLVLRSCRRAGQAVAWSSLLAAVWGSGLFYFTLTMPDTSIGEKIAAYLAVLMIFALELSVFGAFIRGRLVRPWRIGTVVLAGFWWAGTEWLFAAVCAGLSLFLGVTQWQYPQVVRLAGGIGLHGVSILVALGNAAAAWIALALCAAMTDRKRGAPPVRPGPRWLPWTAALLCLVLIIGLAGWGTGRLVVKPTGELGADPVGAGARVLLVLVQSAFTMPEYLKALEDPAMERELFARLLAQSGAGAGEARAAWRMRHGQAASLPPVFVFWPETVLHEPLLNYPAYRDMVVTWQQQTGVWLVAGLPWQEGERYFNSAILVAPNGALAGRYAKVRPIPVAESWVTRGAAWTPLAGAGVQVGVGLCSEIIDPLPARRLTAAGAELLVFLSSLDYLGRSAAPALQAAFAPFRAVEHGRYVAQVGTIGLTLLAAPDGRILQVSPWEVATNLVAEVPLFSQTTVYDRVGDILPVIGLGAGLAGWLLRRRGVR